MHRSGKRIELTGIELTRKRIGKRIAKARKKLGLRQTDLAKKMKVRRSRAWSWEHGKDLPRWPKMIKLAALLELRIGDLVQ